MITKDIARLIHNAYTEIEQAGKMIEELKKSINDKGEFELKNHWGDSIGLELHIPLKSGGHRLERVPFKLALDVINNHVEEQKKELERLKEVARVQLA